MKKMLILAAAAAFVLSSCGNMGSRNLKSEEDSLAYCIGIDLGSYIKNLDSTINVDVVAAGIKDVLANKQKIAQDSTYAFLREYFTVRKPEKQKKASADYLAKIEKDTKGVQKTESGLLYVVETPGNDVKATKDNDQVRVMYKGTLPDGKVFDSSYDRGDTAQFALNQVIKGWAEGMKLVGEGGKIKLWIPSDLAYGEQGAGGQIGPNQAIQFEVELVSVIPGEETVEEAK
ncbi:MAG: FKBP-type peptidyl-prolyl cis-trans isomerase [Rikenellaceae bacterium]|jgi:FKBP-type peptidyl-prolyl cis-trans isomerase|nr:FKBP-type peptidyl-prolyl cis-trans isomerase [Rikenellaceae bacterium]